jgi:hypothetical protein
VILIFIDLRLSERILVGMGHVGVSFLCVYHFYYVKTEAERMNKVALLFEE